MGEEGGDGGRGGRGYSSLPIFTLRGEFFLVLGGGGGAALLPRDFHFHWHCVTEQRFHA